MFSVGKYHELTPCIRGKELLAGFLQTTGISKLWLNADHVFVSTNNGCELFAFDVVPQLKWRRALQTTQNDCILTTSPEPIVEVIWGKSEPSFIYVISESGTTGFWEFLRPSHEWIKHKGFQLNNAKGAKIVEVKLHEETGNVVWCERRGLAVESYCVCHRSITGDTNQKAKVELGSIQAILHNCPPISIFPFSHGVCIHPSQLYLEKIYVFWMGKRDVQGVVFKDEKVEESEVCSSDFRDIATALIGSWSDNPDLSFSGLGITVHPSTQDLLILNRNGVLSKLCVKSRTIKLTPVCNVELPVDIISQEHGKDSKVFANGLIFGLVNTCNVIFLYDILSGKLLSKLEDFTGTLDGGLHALNSCSALPITVFWNLKGIWKLECPSFNELVKTVKTKTQLVGNDGGVSTTDALKDISVNDDSSNVTSQDTFPRKSSSETALNSKVFGVTDVAAWLSASGLEHSACVVMLDHVISSFEADIPETTLSCLRKLTKNVLQSPVLPLGDEYLPLMGDNLNELEDFFEELDQNRVPSTHVTPLNMHVLPFLRELFNLVLQQREIPSSEMTMLGKVNGENAASDMDAVLASVTSGTPDSVGLDRMEILSLQEPGQTVKAFVPENGGNFQADSETAVGRIRTILSEELKDRRWKRRRSPENAVVLGALFKLLYSEHPELLVDVLDFAKKSITEGVNKSEATLQDLQECVREFTLEFLPSVWSEKECDEKRIKIHADILVRLGLERDAIEMLLQRKWWQAAVDLYMELGRRYKDARFTSQLYEILLAGLLRGFGTSQGTLLTKVFELKPTGVQLRNIFELCLINIPSSYAESILDAGNLTVGQARKALGQFLPNT